MQLWKVCYIQPRLYSIPKIPYLDFLYGANSTNMD